MKNFYNMTLFFKYKNFIQVIIAMLIVLVCWHPKMYLHPISAGILIITCYTLHSYIENRITLKRLEYKYSKQEKIISTLYKNSEELIVYRDINGNYIYCNQQYLSTFKLSMNEIRGKCSYNFLPVNDAKNLKEIHKKVLKGKPVNKTIKLGYNVQKYDLFITPIIVNDEIEGILTIAKNITQKEFLQKELARQEQMLRSILDGMPVATYLKDLNGNITYENSMAKDFLGLSDSEHSNKWDYEANRINEIEWEDREILKNKSCIERDKKITLKNNDTRWFNVTKCPIFDNKHEITGILCVARDIELAKKAQDQRETYVATLTHDLKTPTIAQIKALDLLLANTMGELNKDQRDMMILIKESCTYMHEMLSNLLSTYKYENGDYVLNLEMSDILKLIEDVSQELESLLKEKNIKVRIQAPEKVGKIKFDNIQIKRVLVNLLGNAITYAYNDTDIEIGVHRDKEFLKIQITSHSPYINPSLLKSLFEKYVTHAAKYNKIGVGLGLYLSKQIINAHNGYIGAISFEENKNIFEFTIPINL